MADRIGEEKMNIFIRKAYIPRECFDECECEFEYGCEYEYELNENG